MSVMNIVMAQINPLVGDIAGNTQLVIQSVFDAQDAHQADVVIFPELTLCGYPPEDLLLRDSMKLRVDAALAKLARESFSAIVILGYPKQTPKGQYNMAGVLQNGEWIAEYAKQKLPNYKVFDEKRYFIAGSDACVIDIKGIPTAISICEDIWHEDSVLQAKAKGAQLMFNLNASPFHRQKQQQRLNLLASRAQQGNLSIVYVNQVGGQDELVFDGGSFVVDETGQCLAHAPFYEEGLFHLQYQLQPRLSLITPAPFSCQSFSDLGIIYEALVLGLRDYVNKNHFRHVVLGLSGGIDSALTLAIAVDALGAESVEAVMMPFRYTSQLSQDDASTQAQRLGVSYDSISIEPMYKQFMEGLSQQFTGYPVDITEQNLQARCRGVILMALSNKKGSLVLTTGNKSELAVGYSTLYGDMAGGFDALKDVPKTTVFKLAEYRNELAKESGEAEVIPSSVIERPPSAELAPDQKDEDNLPPYEILDPILERYIERDMSAYSIIEEGFDSETVFRIIRLVDINEYKRRQSPVGVRITEKGFGRDRRYPITNGWRAGE